MVRVLLDYDGTLHDCRKIYTPAFRKAYRTLVELGVRAPKNWRDQELERWLGVSPKAMWAEFAPDLPEVLREECSQIIFQEMLRRTAGGGGRPLPRCARPSGAAQGGGVLPPSLEQLSAPLPGGPPAAVFPGPVLRWGLLYGGLWLARQMGALSCHSTGSSGGISCGGGPRLRSGDRPAVRPAQRGLCLRLWRSGGAGGQFRPDPVSGAAAPGPDQAGPDPVKQTPRRPPCERLPGRCFIITVP